MGKGRLLLLSYILGKEEYLRDLLVLLHDDVCYVRCSVTNCLKKILNEKNAEAIRNALKAGLQMEETEARSVICSIQRVLHQIQVDY